MSSSQARSVASTLRVLQLLQARGLAWMATVKSREEVSHAMNGYMATLGIIASELPPMIHVAGTKGCFTCRWPTNRSFHFTAFDFTGGTFSY
jgi:hypothetical protein